MDVAVHVTKVPVTWGDVLSEVTAAVRQGGGTYVNLSPVPAALVPPTAVTVTSTVPATPAGLVAEMLVVELTANEVAALAPNCTAVTDAKLVPVIVTDVPPVVTPVFGVTDVTVGGAT